MVDATTPDLDLIVNEGLEEAEAVGAIEREQFSPGLVVGPYDENGHARCAARYLKPQLRYTRTHGWLSWDGVRWITHSDTEAQRLVIEFLERRRAAGQEAKVDKLAALNISSNLVGNVMKLLRSYLGDDIERYDSRPHLLNCRNGIVNLRTGELIPHDPEYRMLHLADVDYNPKALEKDHWAAWKAFLDENVQEGVSYLQLVTGYSLTGETREEVLFYFYGPSRSGKGTFTEAMLKILPSPLGFETDFNTFTRDRSNDSNNFDLAVLRPARLVIASESERTDWLNPAKVKVLTGGNLIFCSFKRKDHFSYKPRYKIWLVSNHPATADPDDDAIWGRIRLVSFPITHLGREDRTLKRRLHKPEALQALFAWAVRGAMRWYQLEGGIPAPKEMEALRAEFRKRADIVGQWIDDCCAEDDTYMVQGRKLYKSYQAYCKECGYRALSYRKFHESITRRGFKATRKENMRFISGLRLRGDDTSFGY